MPREGASNDDAIDTVFDSMGLDRASLGMGGGDDDDEQDTSSDADDDVGDDGKGPEDFSSDDDDESDDDVVSHNKDDDEDDIDGDRQRGRQDEDQRREDTQFLPRAKMDRKGNIVDKNGKVLAPAGVASRLYRKAYRAERTAVHLDRSRRDVERRLNQAIEIGTKALDDLDRLQKEGTGLPAAKELGLNASEQLEALQLFHLGKTNPTELLKKVLTRASVSGIDVKSLGLQGGIDAKALTETILSEIRKDLKPVQDLTAAQKRQQDDAAALEERTKAVTAELENFFSANPAAEKFLPLFVKVYENPRFVKMSVSEVWSRIQLNLMRRARRNPQGQRSRPNGQRHGGDRGGDQSRNVMTDLTKSYDQLLREVWKEHGPRRG